MAELTRDGDELVLTLSTIEKAESVHGDVRVRLEGVAFDELLVGCENPEAVKSQIGEA